MLRRSSNKLNDFLHENLYDELDEEGNLKAGVFKEALGGVGDAFKTTGTAMRNLISRANIKDKNNEQKKLLIITQSKNTKGKVLIEDFVQDHLKPSGVYKSLNLDGGSSNALAINKSSLKIVNQGAKHTNIASGYLRSPVTSVSYISFECSSAR